MIAGGRAFAIGRFDSEDIGLSRRERERSPYNPSILQLDVLSNGQLGIGSHEGSETCRTPTTMRAAAWDPGKAESVLTINKVVTTIRNDYVYTGAVQIAAINSLALARWFQHVRGSNEELMADVAVIATAAPALILGEDAYPIVETRRGTWLTKKTVFKHLPVKQSLSLAVRTFR